jgi:hypothetical protein
MAYWVENSIELGAPGAQSTMARVAASNLGKEAAQAERQQGSSALDQRASVSSLSFLAG